MLDFVMYADNVITDDFWRTEFQPIVQRMGLETLAVTVGRTAQLYLGMKTDKRNWCTTADDSVCHRFMRYVLDSGNFGEKQGKNKDVRKTLTGFQGIIKTISRLQMEGCYNYREMIGKYPMLKPFAWLMRIVRLFRMGLQSRIGIGDFLLSCKISRA